MRRNLPRLLRRSPLPVPLSLVFLITACGDAGSGSGAGSGRTIEYSLSSDPASLDPYATASFTTQEFSGHGNSRLYKLDANPNTNP